MQHSKNEVMALAGILNVWTAAKLAGALGFKPSHGTMVSLAAMGWAAMAPESFPEAGRVFLLPGQVLANAVLGENQLGAPQGPPPSAPADPGPG